MSSNSNTIPLHQSVGKDVNNWTTLSNKEAKIRAKATEKGHVPHDWRWALSKVFGTNKAYPESLIPALEASEASPDKSDATQTPTTSYRHHTAEAPASN